MALTFANKVTIVRILTVPIFIAALLYYEPPDEYLRYIALAVFLFAVISDVIDGYIARTRHQKTKAGAILDPLADKLLLISAFICLTIKGNVLTVVKLPLWLVVGVISRDVILLLGAMIIYLVQGNLSLIPSKWGKATTFCQICCALSVLLQWQLSPVLWYVTIGLTAISGFGYIREGIKTLNDSNSQNRR